MDSFVDERDYAMLDKDKYTFYVLRRIIDRPCTLLLSDHESLLICFSTEPYPVWIWTRDEAGEAEKHRAYELLKENGFIGKDKGLIVKYDLAEYLISEAKKEGIKLSIKTNMFAYDCPKPEEPVVGAEGDIYRCINGDREELAAFIRSMHDENGDVRMDIKQSLEEADRKISEGRTYFWKTPDGKNVASCSYNLNADLASIGLVFTLPERRRRHYAENLVYKVTKLAQYEGCMPMLYTDADYVASNACYEKIGYVLRGKLCTVG